MLDGRGSIRRRLGARLWLSGTWLGIMLLLAIFAPLISPHDPLAQDLFAGRLPPFWQTVTLFNPVVYLISGFRWAFYGTADINIGISLFMIAVFMFICLGIIGWTFKTGYKIKT